MKVRIVNSVLRYVNVVESDDWKVVKRKGVVGLESKKLKMRVRECLVGEKVGDSWECELDS